MSLSPLQHITDAIADATLAAPAEPAATVDRMTLTLGESADWMTRLAHWMTRLARQVAKRFGARWDSVDRRQVSTMVAGTPGFVSAWRSEQRPHVVRVVTQPPFQRPPPAS